MKNAFLDLNGAIKDPRTSGQFLKAQSVSNLGDLV